ncbi:MAG: HAD family phosphatase [Methylococcaceae bacterium]|jgi:HAD superfamily hydrolase (TIGR01509 family)
MPKLSDFEAVIFDMDGLLIDSETGYCYAWQQAAATMGYEFSNEFCWSMSGLHGELVMQALRAYCGADFNLAQFSQLCTQYWQAHVSQHGIPLKQGVHNMLALVQQHDLPYALATNSNQKNTETCLRLAGILGQFPRRFTQDDVVMGKPAPDLFLTAAASLKVEISRCLVLEDSHAGILAANKAGAYAVLIPSVTPVKPETLQLCQHMATNLAQLAQMLDA